VRVSARSVARGSARHPWRVIGGWLVLLVIGGLLTSRLLSGALTTQTRSANNPESDQAQTLLEQRLSGPRHSTEIVIVRSALLTTNAPAFRAYVGKLHRQIRALGPGVVSQSADVFETRSPQLVSADRHATLIPVTMAGSLDDAADNVDRLLGVTLHARHPDQFSVLVAGEATADQDANTIAEGDLAHGETVGIVFALVVLILVLGTLVAAVLPLVLGIASIVIALGLVSLLGLVFDFSFFVTNMLAMMGLAVGIDYSLFIVSRYREERVRGYDKLDAITAAGVTANRAVFFSGMTVVLALVGMLLIPNLVFRSLAAGAISVVLVAVVASLTLLPALLSVLGDRVNALPVPFVHRRKQDVEHTTGFWAGAAHRVMARPAISLGLGAGLLLAAAVPLLGIKTGFSGVSTYPDDVQSKQAFTVLARDFSGGLTQPAQIVVDGPVRTGPVQQAIVGLQRTLATDRAFGPSTVRVNAAGNLALVSVPVSGDPNGEDAFAAIRQLRADTVPAVFSGVDARVLVGGPTAGAVDFFDLTAQYTPIVFAFVLGLSFLLLMMVFRSVVIPLLGVLLNLLSTGAAYGLLILVFQHGVATGIFGFQQVETIEAWLPLFLFSVLFGLSMDYQVFLLSRIRERYDHTGDNRGAVSFGLRTTGGIITGAALIMVAVFGGFASGRLVFLQEMGFGLGVAVLIDATIVRSVLVPAAMELLGKRNWYLPRWLEWLPQIRVEGPQPDGEPGMAAAPALEPVGEPKQRHELR
jgi:putative drug exporter of the RND superfamily